MKYILFSILLLFSLNAMAQSGYNIVHILADDVGYSDFGCYGSREIKTPNIDALAREGLRFTRYCAPHSTCSPTRAAILTGRYAPRLNNNNGVQILWPDSKTGLDPKVDVSFPELLKKAGYSSALIGKWHIGVLQQYRPIANGFEYYFGIPYPNDMGMERHNNSGSRGLGPIPLYKNDSIIKLLQKTDLPDLPSSFVQEACSFIRAKAADKNPFYLQYANIETHTPWFIPLGFDGISKAGTYGDAVEYLDRTVGIIVQQLKDSKLYDSTIIIITSDNGPLVNTYPELENIYGKYAAVDTLRTKNAPLRGGKYSAAYTGGVQVPFIIKYPGVKGGTINDAIIDGTDLMPTFLSIAGLPLPQNRVLDGRNLVPLINGTVKAVRQTVYSMDGKGGIKSITSGRWKLVIPVPETPQPELYDISKDRGEKINVAAKNKKVLDALLQLWTEANNCLKNDLSLPDKALTVD